MNVIATFVGFVQFIRSVEILKYLPYHWCFYCLHIHKQAHMFVTISEKSRRYNRKFAIPFRHECKRANERNSRERNPALGHFSFSNFFELLLAGVLKNKNNCLKEWKVNYVWKFSFRFVLILLHIKSASKKIWHWHWGRPCLGPYICISINTK